MCGSQAAFHGLPSASRAGDGAAGRAVLVTKPKGCTIMSVPQITCADILFALEEQSAGMTPALLGEFAATHDRPWSEASYVVI